MKTMLILLGVAILLDCCSARTSNWSDQDTQDFATGMAIGAFGVAAGMTPRR